MVSSHDIESFVRGLKKVIPGSEGNVVLETKIKSVVVTQYPSMDLKQNVKVKSVVVTQYPSLDVKQNVYLLTVPHTVSLVLYVTCFLRQR